MTSDKQLLLSLRNVQTNQIEQQTEEIFTPNGSVGKFLECAASMYM